MEKETQISIFRKKDGFILSKVKGTDEVYKFADANDINVIPVYCTSDDDVKLFVEKHHLDMADLALNTRIIDK